MKTEFFMPMIPPTTTAQMHQVAVVNGKPRFYDPPGVKAAKAKLTGHLGHHVPAAPFSGPLRLVVKWCWPDVDNSKHGNGSYKATKPDTDNLEKLLKDVMTTLRFWNDDAQVASEIVEKFWSDVPGIFISIEELS